MTQFQNSCRHSREGGNPTVPLVRYEHHAGMEAAIRREKQIKKWNREWKVKMIEALNPNWIDLHDDIDPIVFYDESKLDSRLRGNDGTEVR